ncbi:tyrosine recombinase XerC [Gemmatimonadota bacterium]
MLDYMNTRINTEGISSSTANREAAFTIGMLSRAVEWDIIESNPLQGLKLFKEPEKRRVRLSKEQAAALLDSLPHPLDEIVELAIYTGFRKENILSLRIEQIRMDDSLETGEADIVVKGGRQEVFPLGKSAVSVLKRAIGNRDSGYVFINPDTGTRYYAINRTYSRAVDKLGLKVGESRLRFHDLRHVFATWLHQSGVSLDALRPLLGHRDRDTTDRYAYLDRKDTGKVLNIMPRIRRKKDLDELTPRSKSKGSFGKNWQGEGFDHRPTLPKIL